MTEVLEIPKDTRPVLTPLPKMIAIKNGPMFDYYAITLGERKGYFVDIEKTPKVMKPGYVTYEGQMYEVSINDLVRRRINVRNPIGAAETDSGESSNGAADNTSAGDMGKAGDDRHKPRVVKVPELQVSEDVNLAWQNQVSELLYLEDPEAEWELVENPSQSESSNEGGTVPDSN